MWLMPLAIGMPRRYASRSHRARRHGARAVQAIFPDPRDPRVQGALIGVPLVLLLVSEALGVRERRASVLIVALRAEIARLEAQLESVGATPRPSPWRQLASALG